MNVFVDTNVLIDFICSREGFYDDAETLFSYALVGKINILFTDISVINTLYVGKKYGYSIDEVSERIKAVFDFCSLSLIDSAVMLNALSSEWKDKEDATQYFSALNSCADIIITRNTKDFMLSEINVATPSEFVAQVLYI